jgi:short-chain fatty acids transporter
MIQSITGFFVSLFNRWMPDAFVVAVILTIFTAIMAVAVTDFSTSDAVLSWGDSIWNLLRFTNQVVLTLLLGHAVAHTPLVHRGLGYLAGNVRSAKMAYGLACFVTGICALLSWGISLIVAGIMARAIGETCKKEGIVIHYPLLVAASYSGFVLFHQGLSGTIPLTVATPDHFLQDTMGIVPFSQTVFSSWNLSLAAIILITLPIVMTRLRPPDAQCEPLSDALLAQTEAVANLEVIEEPVEAQTPASRLDHWRPLNWVLIAAGLYYLGVHFLVRDQGLNLDILNFSFLMLGLGLSRSLAHFVELITDAAKIVGPYLLQYPFYAGIAGIMLASGLAQMVVDVFINYANADTLPIAAFISAAILNIFIPTGGGQWAVQGPIMMDAALSLGADLPLVAMAVAFGDQLTNLIQPIVIVPVLAIAGLHIRQVMGYMVMAAAWCGFVFLAGLCAIVFL